ncbi:MAG TPA: hypothetical protein QF469_13360 [Sphingomonas sanguinis]|uniref:hypothetical protein n=1 Tax=Sphingomonas sanguinis TaxID=33051 RepID=UPI002ABF7EE0|nr:hypothetical protein [Sphingomonas sanguinis]
MRDNMTPQVMSAITAPAITSYLAARLEFANETLFIWTGAHPIQPTGSGDSLLDGNTLEPVANGVAVQIGDNTFSYSGSDEFTISLAVPASPNVTLAAAEALPAEYLTRPATIWRAILIPQADPLAQPIWMFRRVRSGAMDKVEIQNDGRSHNFTLTIESHQSLVSNATNQTYLDQKKYDSTDTSQDYAASIANGDPAPAKAVASSGATGYGGRSPDGSVYQNQVDY